MADIYTGHYNRGWKSSATYRGGPTSPLERADNRREPNSWYDGYMDHAAGREKYHSQSHRAQTGRCPDCDGPSLSPKQFGA